MLMFFRQMFLTRARACVCVVHWHCTAQLSMFNMEKRFRNKIIIIIIIVRKPFPLWADLQLNSVRDQNVNICYDKRQTVRT